MAKEWLNTCSLYNTSQHMKKIIINSLLFLFITGIISCKRDEYKGLDCTSINAKYTADIKPLISNNCNSSGCHGTGSDKGDFTTYNGLNAAVNNGTLNKEVLTKKSMPPSAALSFDDRKKIKCWMDAGAPNN